MSNEKESMAEEQHNPGGEKNDHPWGELNENYHGEGPLPPARKVRKRSLWLGAVAIVCALVAIVAFGMIDRAHTNKKVRQETAATSSPTVLVTHPQLAAPSQEIVLPSNIQAFMDAPIYARTSGYLKAWYFDIGSRVRRGQLLGVIESPEVDQQLAQARADLQTTLANAHLADITANRYSELLKSDSVSKQDTDNAVQQAAAQNASVKAQQANVDRLAQLVAFERVTAPFDGIVTQRNTDVGQLVNAGNGGSAQELFHMQDIHKLRVFINVPQSYATDARPGLPAYITLQEYPEQKFFGTIVRTANSIDVASRTLNVEVDVDNAKGVLLAGAYAAVHIPVHVSQGTYTIPVSALMFRSEGLRVATVINNDTVKLVPIVPGRDYGTLIEVVSGLKAGDSIITNPPDSAVDGTKVRIIQPGGKAPNGSPEGANASGGKGGAGGGTGQSGSGQNGQSGGAGMQGTTPATENGNSQGTQQQGTKQQ